MPPAPSGLLPLLRERRVTVGVSLQCGSPLLTGALAAAGFDWLLLDTLHAPLSQLGVVAQLQLLPDGRELDEQRADYFVLVHAAQRQLLHTPLQRALRVGRRGAVRHQGEFVAAAVSAIVIIVIVVIVIITITTIIITVITTTISISICTSISTSSPLSPPSSSSSSSPSSTSPSSS
jgi:hypothetical protein